MKVVDAPLSPTQSRLSQTSAASLGNSDHATVDLETFPSIKSGRYYESHGSAPRSSALPTIQFFSD